MWKQITASAAATVALATAVAWVPVRAASLPKELAPLGFLLGDWDGGGSGTPGQGSGGTSFATGLQDRIIVRTNFAVIAGTDKTPASRHDDLMIIYVDEQRVVRADYYDNEGHVIRYMVATPADGRAVFTSEASAAGPQYRLTYEVASGGRIKGAFLLAPPGRPDAFAPYLTWEMHRAPRR
jgi:hypothetical protein